MTTNKCADCGIQTLPPGHVAVPVVELEELRELMLADDLVKGRGTRAFWPSIKYAFRSADAILRHIPPKVDHVAVLREMLVSGVLFCETTTAPVEDHNQRAAIEAAIKLMEAQR